MTAPNDHTARYRVRVSGLNDLSRLDPPFGGGGSWQIYFKPHVSTKTVIVSGRAVPEYFDYVARGANIRQLTWDRPASGYIDAEFTVHSNAQRNRGPLIIELYEHAGAGYTPLGTQRSLCVEFENSGFVGHPCPGSFQAQAVDPPTVDGVPALSGAGGDGTWSVGESVGVTVSFSEAVTVDTSGGTPAIGVELGGPGGAARSATYASGSGTTELAFAYTLVTGDGAQTIMGVRANSLATGGGTIRSTQSEVDADLAHVGTAAPGNLARNAAPTASFQNVPTSHDGETAFKVGLRFSGAPAGLSAKRDAASVLEVAGGSVTGARETAGGANPVWEVTVDPDGSEDVVVRVPARECTEEHAVCIGGQALTEAVEATVPGPAMTAEFTQAPNAHDGSSGFDLHLDFSHEPASSFSFRTVETALLDIEGGRITRVWRREAPKNRKWGIVVTPDGDDAVTLAARETTDCTAAHAVCDAEERKFGGELSLTVPGPASSSLPAVSIAVSTTPVTEGTALAFTLRRTGATTQPLTVNVSVTESGTVLESTPPTTVTFASGAATAVLSVPTVDDDVFEDASTVTATVTAGTGYTVDTDAGSASGAVESEDLEPITARFTQVPSEHDGSNPFLLHFAFSHEPAGYSYKTVHKQLFDVTGGSIEKARRLVKGSNVGWEIRVRPDGFGDVALSARATTDCAAQYAACDADGRKFDGELRATVLGPLLLSVADAEVEEAPEATLDFVVTLNRAVSETVTVAYATSDGTATAGDDYDATSGTLTFAADETSKTVSVQVLDDPVDEGSETVTFTLSNPSPSRVKLADAEATGTINNTDAMPKAWIARFGRTVAEQAIEALEARLAAPREAGLSGSVAGHAVSGLGQEIREDAASLGAEQEDGGFETLAAWIGGESRDVDAHAFGSRTLTGREIVSGSSFALTGGSADTGSAAFWGRGAVTSFDGRDGELEVDGEVTSAMLGADFARDALLGGVMLSHARGEGGYRAPSGSGTVESTLTSVFPYGRYALTERVSVWAMAGYGEGTLTLTPEGQASMRPDMDLVMGAAGVRGVLVDGGTQGMTLTAKSDAMAVRTSTGAVSGADGNLAASEADVTRLRLGLEGARPLALGGGAVLTPSLELGLRHDGGDAETGFGADIGAGVTLADPARGLSAELRARGLLTHEDEGLEERGLSGTLAFDPTPASDRGLSLSIAQTVGAQASGGADALFERTTLAGLGAEESASVRRLEARLGYGLGVFDDRFTATPEAGLGLSDAGVEYRLGWRLAERVSSGLAFGLDLEGSRREGADGEAGPEHGLALGLGWRLEGGGSAAFDMRLQAARLEAANDDRPPEHRIGLEFSARW